MRSCSAALTGIAASVVFLVTQDAMAQGPGRETAQSTWYVGVGAGSNRTGVLKQAGFNRDDICYPTNICPRAPDGFSTQTLLFSVYRDFPVAVPGIEPYVGIGVGLSRVELSGLYFRSEYTCVRVSCAGRPDGVICENRRLQAVSAVVAALTPAAAAANAPGGSAPRRPR